MNYYDKIRHNQIFAHLRDMLFITKYIIHYYSPCRHGTCSRTAWQSKPLIITLRPTQNGRHFPDDIFECIFLNENYWVSKNNSLKYVPWGLINNMRALVQIMAWRRMAWRRIVGMFNWRIYASLGLNELMHSAAEIMLLEFHSFLSNPIWCWMQNIPE